MGRTSKKYFSDKFKEKIWGDFFVAIKNAYNEKELEQILKKALTIEELILVEKRLAVIKLLKEGFSYLEIEKEVDVTPVTISFVKKGFKRPIRQKRIYSKDKNQAKSDWHDPLKPQLRPYRFVPKARKRPL